ncbi:hypothetical protein ABK040_005323 [Willaertia magna]
MQRNGLFSKQSSSSLESSNFNNHNGSNSRGVILNNSNNNNTFDETLKVFSKEKQKLKKLLSDNPQFLCSITQSLMKNVVRVVGTQSIYEEVNLRKWLENGGNTDPLTGVQIIHHSSFTSNTNNNNVRHSIYGIYGIDEEDMVEAIDYYFNSQQQQHLVNHQQQENREFVYIPEDEESSNINNIHQQIPNTSQIHEDISSYQYSSFRNENDFEFHTLNNMSYYPSSSSSSQQQSIFSNNTRSNNYSKVYQKDTVVQQLLDEYKEEKVTKCFNMLSQLIKNKNLIEGNSEILNNENNFPIEYCLLLLNKTMTLIEDINEQVQKQNQRNSHKFFYTKYVSQLVYCLGIGIELLDFIRNNSSEIRIIEMKRNLQENKELLEFTDYLSGVTLWLNDINQTQFKFLLKLFRVRLNECIETMKNDTQPTNTGGDNSNLSLLLKKTTIIDSIEDLVLVVKEFLFREQVLNLTKRGSTDGNTTRVKYFLPSIFEGVFYICKKYLHFDYVISLAIFICESYMKWIKCTEEYDSLNTVNTWIDSIVHKVLNDKKEIFDNLNNEIALSNEENNVDLLVSEGDDSSVLGKRKKQMDEETFGVETKKHKNLKLELIASLVTFLEICIDSIVIDNNELIVIDSKKLYNYHLIHLHYSLLEDYEKTITYCEHYLNLFKMSRTNTSNATTIIKYMCKSYIALSRKEEATKAVLKFFEECKDFENTEDITEILEECLNENPNDGLLRSKLIEFYTKNKEFTKCIHLALKPIVDSQQNDNLGCTLSAVLSAIQSIDDKYTHEISELKHLVKSQNEMISSLVENAVNTHSIKLHYKLPLMAPEIGYTLEKKFILAGYTFLLRIYPFGRETEGENRSWSWKGDNAYIRKERY